MTDIPVKQKLLSFEEILEERILAADLSQDPPENEEARQYYFIKKARLLAGQLHAELGRPLTFHINTFGCQMNARDSEKLAGILRAAGYQEIESEDADFVLFNTCTVRDNADQRVFGRLGRISHYKKLNPMMKIGIYNFYISFKPPNWFQFYTVYLTTLQ